MVLSPIGIIFQIIILKDFTEMFYNFNIFVINYPDFVLFFLAGSQMIRQGKCTRNFGPETRHYYRRCFGNESLQIV